MPDPAPTKIGKYEVVEVLGQGGMGVVYKATDNAIGRLVAIKMMTGGFAENAGLRKRFYREAQSTGTLQHPNIVIVHDLGEQEGSPYLVMEFLEGEPLSEIIATRRKLSLAQKLDYIIQGLAGLNYAHLKGIVHRDIKPANLMVMGDGAVKIVDFGIARLGDQKLTNTGQVMGTITYMSPEQINAQTVDGRTDIFSTGVMLYELLTYALPFEGKDTTATMLKILSEPPPPLETYLPGFPAELEGILHKALAKEREERYATAEDFALDLRRVQESARKELLGEYVEQAKASLEKQELSKAKELLQLVLKVDTQHHVAQELMREVQQRLQQQQRSEQVRELRSRAAEALAQKLYDDALAYAEQALTLDKTDPELLSLRDQAQQAKDKKKKLEDALTDQVQEALHRQDSAAAGKLVSDALAQSPDDPVLLKLQAQIARQTKPAQPVRTVAAADPSASQTIVAGSYESSGKMPAMPEPPAHQDKTIAVPEAHVSAESRGANVGHPKTSPALKIALAVVALLVLAAGAYFGYQRSSGATAAGSYIEIHAVPWGTVRSVTSLDGKIAISVNEQTPVRVNVPPGTYKVVVTGPHGEEKSEDVTVFINQPGSYSAVFQTKKLR
jgi:serine/threonine-protein kinase